MTRFIYTKLSPRKDFRRHPYSTLTGNGIRSREMLRRGAGRKQTRSRAAEPGWLAAPTQREINHGACFFCKKTPLRKLN